MGGPFAGLEYKDWIFFGPVTPRWLGTYEKELHAVIRQMVEFSPDEVVDIGAAEGYYSMGMAKLLPHTPVYSYETNPVSIWQQSRLKKINSLGNLHISRYCDQGRLAAHGKSRSVIISDIEGFEMDLFSEEVVSKLGNSLVLIEIHSHMNFSLSDVCQAISSRFLPTHSVTEVFPAARTLSDWEFGDTGLFSNGEKIEFMNEYRGQKQVWLVCEPV
jgi:hypothetical protein